MKHASFRDEAQAWLWAIRLQSLRDYLVIPYEGHPPLWYWLLKLQSLVMRFNEARWLGLAVAIANAALLWRLLPRQPVLYALILSTQTVLVFWGFFYRPYGLVLTFVLAALVMQREGRPIIGTWIMAVACGLHFFAGFVFAFWLAIQIRRRISLRRLALPALLALGFGLLAVLSAQGNPRGDLDLGNAIVGTLQIFTLPFQISSEPWQIWLLLMSAMIGIAFWRDRFLLLALTLSLLAFCLFGQFVYFLAEWHYGLITVLILTAFFLAGDTARIWPILVIMLPQAVNGLASAVSLLATPYSSALMAYEAVVADAGARLVPERNLVSWPDWVLTAPSALRDFEFISGDTGRVIGPTLYDDSRPEDFQPDPAILVRADTPYWLVCLRCEAALLTISASGLRAVEVFPPTAGNHAEALAVYRVEAN